LLLADASADFPSLRADEHIPLTSSSRQKAAARASGLTGKQVLRQRCNKLGASAGSSILSFIFICPFLFLCRSLYAQLRASVLPHFFLAKVWLFLPFSAATVWQLWFGVPPSAPNPHQSMPNQNASHDQKNELHHIFGNFKRALNGFSRSFDLFLTRSFFCWNVTQSCVPLRKSRPMAHVLNSAAADRFLF
jgi:hypothetical protein